MFLSPTIKLCIFELEFPKSPNSNYIYLTIQLFQTFMKRALVTFVNTPLIKYKRKIRGEMYLRLFQYTFASKVNKTILAEMKSI